MRFNHFIDAALLCDERFTSFTPLLCVCVCVKTISCTSLVDNASNFLWWRKRISVSTPSAICVSFGFFYAHAHRIPNKNDSQSCVEWKALSMAKKIIHFCRSPPMTAKKTTYCVSGGLHNFIIRTMKVHRHSVRAHYNIHFKRNETILQIDCNGKAGLL